MEIAFLEYVKNFLYFICSFFSFFFRMSVFAYLIQEFDSFLQLKLLFFLLKKINWTLQNYAHVRT